MGALLFFIGLPVAFAILGWIIEIIDKQKEDTRQKEITERASYNLRHKNFLTVGSYKRGLSLVKVGDFRWCYIQRNGVALNEGQLYFSAEEFEYKTVIVGLVEGGYNIMDTSGRYLLPVLYDKKKSYYVKRIIPGFYSVSVQTEIGKHSSSYEYHVYNEDGTRLNQNPLSSEATYSDGLFIIRNGDKETRMDKNGKLETPFFKSKEEISESLYIVTIESSYVFGLYDAQKDIMILPCAYESLFYCKEFNKCIVKERVKEGKWERGKCLIPPEFRYRIIDLTGKIIYDSKDNFCSVVDGKFILTRKMNEDSKPLFGAILLNGKEIFKPLYNKILVNDSGTLFFALSDKCCYVSDQAGNIVSTYDFLIDSFGMDDTITIYKHIYPSVYIDNGMGVIPSKMSALSTKDIAIIIRSSDGKKGVLSLENKIVIPAIYDSLKQINNENDIPVGIIVENNGNFGAISLSGEIIVPIRYASISYEYEGSDSYVPLHDIESDNFYEQRQELDHWKNWKSGRGRLLKLTDKNGNTISYTIDGDKYNHVPNEQGIKRLSESIPTPISADKPNLISSKKVKQPTKYLFFDTETAGLPKNHKAPSSDLGNWPRLVQLSWMLTDDKNRTISEGNYIIKPKGFTISESSATIHGITTDIALQNGVDLSIAINKFLEDYKQCDIIVGHNISFDRKILGAEMIRLGMKDLLKWKKSICTMMSSVDLCKLPGKYGYKYPQLQELHKELFGKNFDNAHNSAVDVEATVRCFFEMKRRELI